MNMRRSCGFMAAVPPLLLAAALAGCATVGAPPEKAVAERAQERLDHLLAGELESAYTYFAPGYRSSVSLTNWQREWISRRVVWDSATVTGSECSEAACKVMVSLDISAMNAVPGVQRWQGSTEMVENWARIDGGWYLVP